MVIRPFRHFIALFALIVLSQNLRAQTFQRLNAYGPLQNVKNGIYEDLAELDPVGLNGEEVVAIGTTDSTHGLLAYHQADGTPVSFFEFPNPLGHPVEANAVCRMASGDIVACFYDPVDRATDVVRATNNGTLVWSRRITYMKILDVVSDSAALPGGEGIWLTGSNGDMASIAAFDGNGASLFQYIYYFGANYANSLGQELSLNSGLGELTVVGTVESDTCTASAILLFQTDLNGNFIFGRTYGDETCQSSFRGKSLSPSPANAREFLVAFEHDLPGVPTTTRPGLLKTITGPFSTWVPSFVKNYKNSGPGFFRGNNFRVGSLSSDGTDFLMAGNFNSFATLGVQASAYSLKVDIAGKGLQFNEYETSATLASKGSYLRNLIWNNAQSMYYLVGEFNAVPNLGSWPRGTDPQSFWMLGADANGGSVCSNKDSVRTTNVNLITDIINASRDNVGSMLGCPLGAQSVNPRTVNRCANAKTWEEPTGSTNSMADMRIKNTFEGLRVSFSDEIAPDGVLQILDLQGRVLLQKDAQKGESFLPTHTLSQGIYLIRLRTAGQTSQAQKFIIH